MGRIMHQNAHFCVQKISGKGTLSQ